MNPHREMAKAMFFTPKFRSFRDLSFKAIGSGNLQHPSTGV